MTTVIYHKSDYDGIFCREIAMRHFGEAARYVGWEYGEAVPEIAPGTNLYMLDISVAELMDHKQLTWIDHHKSAMDKYPTGIRGWRIDGVAACRLSWQWFSAGESRFAWALQKADFVERKVLEPFAVCLAGEYDIWDKHDERAELFQHGLRSEELDWTKLLAPDLEEGLNPYVQKLLEQGKALQFAKQNEDASVIKALGFDLLFEGLRFLACNHGRYNSHLFTAGLKPEHDALLGFKWAQSKWSVSLYHAPGREQHNLAAIAAKHGGGGHKGACGFTCEELPFVLVPAKGGAQ